MTRKIKQLEVEGVGGHVLQCPIAGDANYGHSLSSFPPRLPIIDCKKPWSLHT